MTRRTQALFLLALLGVLAVVGAGVGAVLGPVAVACYAALAVALLLVGGQRARAAARAAEPVRTCSCCTTTVHDPVRVI